MIFAYSLNPDYLSGGSGYPVEGGHSSQRFGADDDVFFRVPKNKLIESKQFDQIINPTEEPPLTLSLAPRLGIM